jgi:hypothetical protein
VKKEVPTMLAGIKRTTSPQTPDSALAARFTRMLLVTVVTAATFCGCGYSIRAPFDKRIKTVFVPVLKTQSFRRDVNLNLTELIQKEIMHRTPYKVVGTPEEADTILEGTINYADKNIVVENPFNLPRELNGTINVSVKWTHNPPTDAEKNQIPTIIAETVNFVPEVGETSLTAFYRINQNIAAQIVDMMEQPWYTDSDLK